MSLGEQILAQLDRNGNDTILSRWMAHRIAELIERAEDAPDEATRDAIRRECSDVILRLWGMRHVHPGISPLSEMLPLLQQLIPQPSYFRQIPRPPARTWNEALDRIHALQEEELRVCWDAIFLQLDQQELADRLARSEAILGEIDERERDEHKLLRQLDARAASYGELRNASPEEQTQHFIQQLAEISAEREVQFRSVKSVRTSLSNMFNTSDEDDLDEARSSLEEDDPPSE